MNLFKLVLYSLVSLSLCYAQSEGRALFSKKELLEVQRLKKRDLKKIRIEKIKKSIKLSSMYPFKMTRKSEVEEYKKLLIKMDGHYYDQIERTFLFKDMFEDFLKSE